MHGLSFSYDDLVFGQPDAIKLTRVNAATLDNWLRYDHIRTTRDGDGRRQFAFSDLLHIDCVEMLTTMFKMPPMLAAEFGRRAVRGYEKGFAEDRANIAAGANWAAVPSRDLDAHFTFAREGDAVVEVADGDQRADSVMLVLPTRMIARRLLAAIRQQSGASRQAGMVSPQPETRKVDA